MNDPVHRFLTSAPRQESGAQEPKAPAHRMQPPGVQIALTQMAGGMLFVRGGTDDEGEHSLAEAQEAVAKEFHTPAKEREQLLPSGRQGTFYSRVGWAKAYLQKAGLIESTGWGRFRVTSRGKDVLRTRPSRIDLKTLSQFSGFKALGNPGGDAGSTAPAPAESARTPEELLEDSYQALRRRLADDLLEQIKRCSPRFFEKLVVDLLLKMGYGGSRKDAGELVGPSGDEGIDGLIKEDRLGLDVVYIQAKRWADKVGRPVVQAFAGSLEGKRARKGVLITTSEFSSDASDYVKQIEKKIVLIDGETLSGLMIDNDVGVLTSETYALKRMDADYFTEDQ